MTICEWTLAHSMPVDEPVYTRCDHIGQAHWVPASKGPSLRKHFNYPDPVEEAGGVRSLPPPHWALYKPCCLPNGSLSHHFPGDGAGFYGLS